MTHHEIPDLGPLEHQLLRILWKGGSLTAKDVLDQYNASSPRPLAYTTVMTLLTRMVEKGALSVDRGRQPFVFTPRITREQLLSQRVCDFVDQFFDGQAAELAVRLVEQQPLSDETLRRLAALIDQYRQDQSRFKSAAQKSPSEGDHP